MIHFFVFKLDSCHLLTLETCYCTVSIHTQLQGLMNHECITYSTIIFVVETTIVRRLVWKEEFSFPSQLPLCLQL